MALCLFVNEVSLSNYRPISVLNNIAKGFGFVVHDHMSHWFQHNMIPLKIVS
jgi:hypothetical protein